MSSKINASDNATNVDTDLDEITENEEIVEEEVEEIEPEEDLLYKNTESFRCLAQLQISRSSLLQDPFYWFPELEDPELYNALWIEDPPPVYNDIGCERYKDVCKEEGIKPYRRVLENLENNFLDLRFFGLSEKQMKAICAALGDNRRVKHVSFQENFLTEKSLLLINDMLNKNDTIQILDLSHCFISPDASKSFCEGFAYNTGIEELDLSWNEIGDDGMAHLMNAIKHNKTITKLNLSHNLINDAGLIPLGETVQENYTLVDLDMSWNYLYKSEGMKEFMDGLTENMSIKKLNLSWCGIGDKENMRHIMNYLKHDMCKVQELDLSNNRIFGTGAKMLKTGLKFNSSVETINLQSNPLAPAEVEALAYTFLEPRSPDLPPLPLQTMDLSTCVVNKTMIKIRNSCRRKGRTVLIGKIVGNYKVGLPDFKTILLERAKFVALNQKKKKFRQDIGIFMISLPDLTSWENSEFNDMMAKFKIKLEPELLDQLLKTFINKDGELNPLFMKQTYLGLYPDTKLPEKKPKKKKKKKPKSNEEIKKPETEATKVEGEQQKTEGEEVKIDGEQKEVTDSEAPPTDTETEAPTDTEGQTDTEAPTDTEGQTDTEAPTDTEGQTDTEALTDTEAKTDTEAQTDTEAVQTETEGLTEMKTEELTNTEKEISAIQQTDEAQSENPPPA